MILGPLNSKVTLTVKSNAQGAEKRRVTLKRGPVLVSSGPAAAAGQMGGPARPSSPEPFIHCDPMLGGPAASAGPSIDLLINKYRIPYRSGVKTTGAEYTSEYIPVASEASSASSQSGRADAPISPISVVPSPRPLLSGWTAMPPLAPAAERQLSKQRLEQQEPNSSMSLLAVERQLSQEQKVLEDYLFQSPEHIEALIKIYYSKAIGLIDSKEEIQKVAEEIERKQQDDVDAAILRLIDNIVVPRLASANLPVTRAKRIQNLVDHITATRSGGVYMGGNKSKKKHTIINKKKHNMNKKKHSTRRKRGGKGGKSRRCRKPCPKNLSRRF